MNINKAKPTFSIPRTVQWSMFSAERREYRISVYTPVASVPAEGYPVLYLLDANAVFGSVVEALYDCMRNILLDTSRLLSSA